MSNISSFQTARRLAHRENREDEGALDPEAAGVIAKLSGMPRLAELTAVDARLAYANARRPFLAPSEAVAGISRIRPATAGVPPLAVFRPLGADENELLPGLVFYHGGGWVLGGLDTYEPFVRALANATGSSVVWVDYRLAPEHPFPAAIDDALAAARWVQRNAQWLGLDPLRLAVGGDSAGGNLAAVVALAARDGLISFDAAYQLLLYPCLDLTAGHRSHETLGEGYLLTSRLYAWYRRLYLGGTGVPADWRASPLFASSFSDLPHTILLTAGFDPLRDEGFAYGERLAGMDVTVEHIHMPGMIHGFLTMGGAISAAGRAIEALGKSVRRLNR